MMRFATTVLLVGLGCGLGLGLYIGHRGSSAELRAAHAAVGAAESAAAARASAPSLCVASLDRQVLREELARTLGKGVAADAPEAATSPAKEDPPPPTPQRAVALDRARQGVDEVLARGSVTSEEVEDLRTLLLQVDEQTHYRLATELVVAMNQGKLKVEAGRAMF